MHPDELLVVFAMEEEERGLLKEAGARLLFTRLGKVNAAHALTRALHEGKRPKRVVNFGTAGSRAFPRGALVECTRLVQRDMDVTMLGFPHGQTPFDPEGGALTLPRLHADWPEGSCGTGDSFETGAPKVACDVVDMEAYALGKVCLLEGVPFTALKYVSDGSDEGAPADWQASLPLAAAAFLKAWQRLLQG